MRLGVGIAGVQFLNMANPSIKRDAALTRTAPYVRR